MESKKRIKMNFFAEEIDSRTLKNLWIRKGTGGGGGRDGLGAWDWHMHTEVYGMIGQWGPAIQHKELYPIFHDNLCGKRIWKRINVCTCITESLWYSRNYYNLVNQLYFNKTLRNKKFFKNICREKKSRGIHPQM